MLLALFIPNVCIGIKYWKTCLILVQRNCILYILYCTVNNWSTLEYSPPNTT